MVRDQNVDPEQRAKKVVSDSPGLVGFAIALVNSVINLPDGQVKFFEEPKLQRNCEINLLIKRFLGLVEMMFGLVMLASSFPTLLEDVSSSLARPPTRLFRSQDHSWVFSKRVGRSHFHANIHAALYT